MGTALCSAQLLRASKSFAERIHSQVCWSGKGLLYDLQYDLPASRFAHPDGSYSVSQDDDFQSDRSDGPGPVRMVAKAHNLMELDQSFEVFPNPAAVSSGIARYPAGGGCGREPAMPLRSL